MQTDEQQKFRFNWQVGVIIALTMVALIIPLGGVAYFFYGFLHPKEVKVVVQAEPPFRKSLEDLANEKLGSAISLQNGNNSIEIQAADVEGEVSRIGSLAKSMGGFALPAEKEGENARLTIQIPQDQVEPFFQACRNPQASPKSAGLDGARVLVEVLIKTKTP